MFMWCWRVLRRHWRRHRHRWRIGRHGAHSLVLKSVTVAWVCLATSWPFPVGNASRPPAQAAGIESPGFVPFPLRNEWVFAGPPVELPPELGLMAIPIQPPPQPVKPVKPVQPVPEPGSFLLLVIALAGFVTLFLKRER